MSGDHEPKHSGPLSCVLNCDTFLCSLADEREIALEKLEESLLDREKAHIDTDKVWQPQCRDGVI